MIGLLHPKGLKLDLTERRGKAKGRGAMDKVCTTIADLMVFAIFFPSLIPLRYLIV